MFNQVLKDNKQVLLKITQTQGGSLQTKASNNKLNNGLFSDKMIWFSPLVLNTIRMLTTKVLNPQNKSPGATIGISLSLFMHKD